jgi:hypothetical protein
MNQALFERLLAELRRIWPEEETSGFSFLELNPAELLLELEQIPDGAGPQAIVAAVERALTRQFGPPA